MVKTVIIQASSTAWSGGQDLCMNEINGRRVVYRTVESFLIADPNVRVVVAAPEFDKGGRLDTALKDLMGERISIYYGQDASPLKRMVAITQDMSADDYIIRADGLHFAVDVTVALDMLDKAKDKKLDCMKFPDDFPIQFSADIYRVGALRKYADMDIEPAYHVHPKYGMFADAENFKCGFTIAPHYSDEHLKKIREIARTVYVIPRLEVNEKSIAAGDQLSFHYEKAAKYLSKDSNVLDIACGDGYGSRYLAGFVKNVTGGDLELSVVERAIESNKDIKNVSFSNEDVTAMSFADASFDAVVSMETVEHVDDHAYIAEIARVIKPGGRFILSTPQNSMGHIPVNAEHVREYSLDAITDLCSKFFDIVEVIGIKQGRIIVPDSPKGSNIMIIAERKAN